MKQMLLVICFLFLAMFIYINVLYPTHEQLEQYQHRLHNYANGISA